MSKELIGANIRRLRKRAGFTQKSIAKFLDVDQSLVSKIESGERCLSADMLEKLSNLFGVTIDQLETQEIAESHLSFAFRGDTLSADELEAISDINRIALNSEFLHGLLEV